MTLAARNTALDSPAEFWRPGGLWSLWELMQQFNGGKLFIGITGLSNMGHGLQPIKPFAVPQENHEDVKRKIVFVCDQLEKLELLSSLASARELKKISTMRYTPFTS